MATAKKLETDGANQTPAANVDAGSKFTWNTRGWQESLTIRCDSEEELKILRDRWSVVINPPRRKIPYMHAGDTCLVEGCEGVLLARNGTNRRTQKPYRFLRCSKHPTCNFTAYIETEENTPEQNGDNGQSNGGTANGQQPAVETAGASASA